MTEIEEEGARVITALKKHIRRAEREAVRISKGEEAAVVLGARLFLAALTIELTSLGTPEMADALLSKLNETIRHTGYRLVLTEHE